MSNATKQGKHEVLVPLSELWPAAGLPVTASVLPSQVEEQVRLVESIYGETVTFDYAGRPAVDLEAAYRIGAARQKAEAELAAAAEAEELERARLEAWRAARVEFWRHNLPQQARRRPNAGQSWDAINAARQATADACMAAEKAAGVSEDIAARLGWPPHDAALVYTESHAPYQPPTLQER